MKNYFDIKRFWNVLKRDFFLVWQLLAIALFVPLVLCSVFAIFDEEFSMYYNRIQPWVVVSVIACLFSLATISCQTYKNFTNKKECLNTLALPASQLEKMTSRLIYCWLLPSIIYILHSYCFWHLPVVEYSFRHAKDEDLALILFGAGYFWTEMVLVILIFWGSIFRKFIAVPSALAIAATIYLFLRVSHKINMLCIDGIVRYIYSGKTNFIVVEAAVLVMFGLISFGLSYWILSRKQIR